MMLGLAGSLEEIGLVEPRLMNLEGELRVVGLRVVNLEGELHVVEVQVLKLVGGLELRWLGEFAIPCFCCCSVRFCGGRYRDRSSDRF